MNTQYNNQTPIALGGFFSWLRRAVGNVANAISELSHNPFFLIDIIEDAFNGNGFNIGNSSPWGRGILPDLTQDVTLTVQDENKLDFWVSNNFTPFFKTYFSTIKSFYINPPSTLEFNHFYNDAMEFIGLLAWYQSYSYSNRDTNYSIEAIQARNQFINIQIELLKAEINNYVASTNIFLNAQLVSKNVSMIRYEPLGLKLPINQTISIFQIDVSDTNNNVGVVIPDEPQVSTGSQVNGNSNKSTGAGLFVLALIGLGFLYSMNNSEEKEEKIKE